MNKEEGWFELNSVHIKCFMEEYMPGNRVYLRYVPRYVDTTFRVDTRIKRKVVTIKNEDLLEEFNGSAHPKVRVFKFWFRDFVSSDFLKEALTEDENKEEVNDDNEIF